MEPLVDYEHSGLNIKRAMLDHIRKFPEKSQRPAHIIWGGREIKVVDWIEVPTNGTVRFEFISGQDGIEQGFDAKLEGWFELEQKEKIPVLRTWKDDRYEDVVEYPFFSRDNRMGIWNVYKEHLPNGQIREDKWSGNAGCWIEKITEYERIYHCSPGMLDPPDFESLVFKVTITATT